MTKIAIVVDGDHTYPVYRTNGTYTIDFGGRNGMSEALKFPTDVKAINWFRKTVEDRKHKA